MNIINNDIQEYNEHNPKDKNELLNELFNKIKLILLKENNNKINNIKQIELNEDLNNKNNLLIKSNNLKKELKSKIYNIENDISILKSKIQESLNIEI